MLSDLRQVRGVTAWHPAAVAATLLAAILTATLTHGEPSAGPGHLAQLLADNHAGVLAAHVAPSARADLAATRLTSAWSAAVDEVGTLRAVNRHYLVREGEGAQDELEVLQFTRGSGVLTAHRTTSGITGLVLLVSAINDSPEAAAAAAYAQDLVTGRLQVVQARFDATMAGALPPEVFTAETAAVTAGLRPPVTVAGQIVVRRAGLTVVETYLLFGNGLRRVEMTLEPNGSIAGLYIRPL